MRDSLISATREQRALILAYRLGESLRFHLCLNRRTYVQQFVQFRRAHNRLATSAVDINF